MPTYDVAVRLDEPGRSFASGDAVTGTVVVTPDTDVASAKLIVEQLWRVHGRGNAFEKVIAEEIDLMPDLIGLLPRQHRFRFSAPGYPVSYHGNHINVDHCLRARVDLSLTLDPTAELDYVVAPGSPSADAYLQENSAPTTAKASGCAKVVGWVLLPILVPLLVLLLAMVLPIVIIGVVVVFVRRRVAEGRLGRVTVEIGAPTVETTKPYSGPGAGLVRKLRPIAGDTFIVSPNQVVPVTVRFTPSKDVTVSGAVLKLEAQEHATSGSGKNSRTYHHTIGSKTMTLVEPGPIVGGNPIDVTVQVELPQTNAYSLEIDSNKIAWTVAVQINVTDWPDWVRSHSLLMIPPR